MTQPTAEAIDEKLHTPRAFHKRFADRFPIGAPSSLRTIERLLEQRARNNLATSGAAVETRFGVMIHPAKFMKWLLIECPSDQDRA